MTTQHVSRSAAAVVPPQGSRIEVGRSGNVISILVPYRDSGYAKYFIAAFMLFWLGGWAVGFTNAFSQIAKGTGSAFLVFWLGAWTVGGGWAAYTLFRLVRPPIPERLELHEDGLYYDSGRPSLQWPGPMMPRGTFAWATVPRRVTIQVRRDAITTLRLRDTDIGNRLTIDHGSDRIELARDATDIEREWLFAMLTEHYGTHKTK